MTIACLGWGSLIWDHGGLPVASEWHRDGPSLPVEFARQSQNGRITLVITETAKPVPVLWCRLDVKSPAEARAALAEREGITAKNTPRLIGMWSAGDVVTPASAAIAAWGTAKEIQTVVWTALGPKFSDKAQVPSCVDVLRYLETLNGEKRDLAETYIRKAPTQIRTEYRAAIEERLGWHQAGI